MRVKQKLARSAAKKTAKHTARGTASKLKRSPLRSTALLLLGAAGPMAHRVLAIVTDGLGVHEGIEEIRRHGADVELRVVVPAIEHSAFEHALGDVDEPRREAAERLELTLAALRRDGPDHEPGVAEVEEAGAGTFDPAAEREIGSAYLPGLSRGDFAGMAVGVLGTIVAIVLAAAAGVGNQEVGWEAVAIGVALINLLILLLA